MTPYFPISKTTEYHKAQKVFGVININKMLATISPHDRRATAESIIIDGTTRYNDPMLDLRSHVLGFGSYSQVNLM
ncbi:hypothetical protein Ddye_020560 [Dipteronia dyeriana]|uniref:LOB domain-containing protein n=1 Tax=Dipteronia dyeriana TaxID=168575 RepID=A0AAD9TZY3_9ROSI|nr:hypothetical protein Ddye_020560 [Dipteronia dyeriana]